MELDIRMRELAIPLLFGLIVLNCGLLVVCLSPSLNDDVLGLIVFKADIQDPNGKLASWSQDDDSPCNWAGINCDPRSNRVIDLVLDDFSLSGRIGKGLLQLQFLRKLSLAKNNLTGGISSGLVRLENLRFLDLSENALSGTIDVDFFNKCGPLSSISLAMNQFSGMIPDTLSSCSGLAALNFSMNQFSGSLPSDIWLLNGLLSLDLSGNMLEGEIPKGMDGLANLKTLNLQMNWFSGSVPNDIGSCLLLRTIDLSDNAFSGSPPDAMQKLALCNYLDFHGNSFAGELPSWLGQMSNLETLDLSSNGFSGIVPSSIGNLGFLKVLNISANRLTGSLPESISNCRNLQELDFSRNLLTGYFPTWVFKLGVQKVVLSANKFTGGIADLITSSAGNSYQKLQVLDLSVNSLSGVLTSEVSDLTSLQLLNLSGNTLSGSIPATVGKLKNLSILDLSGNQLNGSIPSNIGGATSLMDIRLDGNHLAGEIPDELEKCSSLKTLILSHNNLNGRIPASLAKIVNLQHVDVSFNSLTGSLPKQLTNLVHLLSFNISHNDLQGELPLGGFFNTISPSSLSGNPSLCGSIVKKSCSTVLPKPIVLNPNSSSVSGPGSLPSSFGHKKIILSISALVAIGAAVLIVIGVIAVTVLNIHARSSTSRSAAAILLSRDDDFSRSPTTDANSGKLVMFSGDPDFSMGTHALLNKDCELGRGGFGAVYRTVLGDGRPVAIKKLTVSSLVKSQEDFEREVKKLGKVRHQNLVALEGYYWTPSLQLLISEFVSGGSLYTHLHESSGGNLLSWNERFNIILGTARSLAHLHQLNIIHYNVKSSNVLIDESGEPKVADFGLARLLPMLDRYVLSSKIRSALGYMAPEFACRTVKITEKCDVYGFGVLLLEIVTGKKPIEYMEDDVVVIFDMVRENLEEGRVEECVDERLHGNFPTEEAIPVMKLGLICTSQVPSSRPDLGEVVNILELIRCPSEGQEET